jgi:D-alanine-D-alanine ligase-like ATP-grasp enzyme
MKPLLQDILERLGRKLDAKVIFADQFGYAGYIEFESGHRTFFKGTSFDLNPQGASRIAAGKDYVAKILKRLEYEVPDGILLVSAEYRQSFQYRNPAIYESLSGLESALKFAEVAGFPLFVKPNEESEGRGVSRVYHERQLVDDIQTLFSLTDQVLVQKPLVGHDFRVVVLDGEIISAYRRYPFRVRGDGQRSIRSLIDAKIIELHMAERGKKINATDWRF